MDVVAGLLQGFALLLTPGVLAACIIGLTTGVVIGFLPGVSPAGGLALAFSFVGAAFLNLGSDSPAVFVVAVAYGTLYGRTLAAMNLSASESVNVDRHAEPEWPVMVGGLIAAIVAAAAVGVIAAAGRSYVMMYMGPIEFAAAIIFLLLAGVAFGSGSTASAAAVAVAGLLLGLVGDDIDTEAHRLSFNIPALAGGFGVVNAAIGLFVIANVIHGLDPTGNNRERATVAPDRPARGFLARLILAVPAGLLPTNGAAVASAADERRARPTADPHDPANEKGARGIISAALASDVRFSVALIPVLIWLFPSDVIGALLQRIISAQETLTRPTANRGGMIWLVCATLIPVHVVPLTIIALRGFVRWRPIRIDLRIVAPPIIAVCCIITYLAENSLTSLGIMFAFGVLGYVMILADFDRSLLFFALVFGVLLDENIRRGLLVARGDLTIFVERPISVGFLIAGVLLLVAVRAWRYKR